MSGGNKPTEAQKEATMMQPVAATKAHVNAVRGIDGVLRARRGTYVASHKIIFDVASGGTLSMALFRVNGVSRWCAGDSDDIVGFEAAESARTLIARAAH